MSKEREAFDGFRRTAILKKLFDLVGTDGQEGQALAFPQHAIASNVGRKKDRGSDAIAMSQKGGRDAPCSKRAPTNCPPQWEILHSTGTIETVVKNTLNGRRTAKTPLGDVRVPDVMEMNEVWAFLFQDIFKRLSHFRFFQNRRISQAGDLIEAAPILLKGRWVLVDDNIDNAGFFESVQKLKKKDLRSSHSVVMVICMEDLHDEGPAHRFKRREEVVTDVRWMARR